MKIMETIYAKINELQLEHRNLCFAYGYSKRSSEKQALWVRMYAVREKIDLLRDVKDWVMNEAFLTKLETLEPLQLLEGGDLEIPE